MQCTILYCLFVICWELDFYIKKILLPIVVPIGIEVSDVTGVRELRDGFPGGCHGQLGQAGQRGQG